MELFSKVPEIDFLGARRWAMPLTLAFIAASIGSLGFRGLNLGVDFTGGVVLEYAYPAPAELGQVRTALAGGGFDDAVVQHFGSSSDVLVRLPPLGEGEKGALLSDRVTRTLVAADPGVELRRVEFVGPQVGAELAEQGLIAMTVALSMIFLYLMFRFEWKFALGAIAATVHDVIFTIGWFSIFGLEFDLTVLAAVLAVVGYSVNDTVVVFDRIRENFRTMRRGTPAEVMNRAINETLSRTIMTASTVFVVLVALLVFGGKVIHGFSVALMIGLLVGTYSSVYIASASALMLGASRETLMPSKRDEELDALP
jgi:preprotein translocase subunit SecF